MKALISASQSGFARVEECDTSKSPMLVNCRDRTGHGAILLRSCGSLERSRHAGIERERKRERERERERGKEEEGKRERGDKPRGV